jgi:hypothetical protein
MDVACLGSVMKAPRYEDNDEVLAKKQAVVMNVAYLGSGMRVPGCQGDDDSVGNDSDSGNKCCLLLFCYKGLWLPCQ